MASVWKLPVLFVLENNLYGEYSAVAQTTNITVLAERAASYGMPGMRIDGNDVRPCNRRRPAAIDHARRGDGPVLVEADTYRHHGHSRSDRRPTGRLGSSTTGWNAIRSWLLRDQLITRA